MKLSISNMLLIACRAQFPLSNERCLVCLRKNITEEYIIEVTSKISVFFELSRFLFPEANICYVLHFIFHCSIRIQNFRSLRSLIKK